MLLNEDAPDGLAETLREDLEEPERLTRVTEIADGPPVGGVEISVSGPSYEDITAVSDELMMSLANLEGIVNLESNVTQSRTR